MDAYADTTPVRSGLTVSQEAPSFDACHLANRFLSDGTRVRSLRQPVTRRLLVDGVGHYEDRDHGHVDREPRGTPYSSLYVCVKGSARLSILDRRYRISEGCAFVLPAGLPFEWTPDELPWSVWWCAFYGTDALEFLGTLGLSAVSPIQRLWDPRQVIGVMDEIYGVYSRQGRSAVIEATGLAWRLLTRLSADHELRAADPVEQVQDQIAADLAERLSVPRLASKVGLSPSALNRAFRMATGMGVLDYQISRRMDRARFLLSHSDDSISDVARQVGYEDPHYFSRQFRKRNGVSPLRFREDRSDAVNG